MGCAQRSTAASATPVAAVVSSLPLLYEPPERRLDLLDAAFELMGQDGVFVQFTYGLRSPIPRDACAGKYLARCGPPVLRNLPPAKVQLDSAPARPIGDRPGFSAYSPSSSIRRSNT